MRPRNAGSLPAPSIEDDSTPVSPDGGFFSCRAGAPCFAESSPPPDDTAGVGVDQQQQDRHPVPAEILQPEELEVLARSSPAASSGELGGAEERTSLDRSRCPVTDCVERACAKLDRPTLCGCVVVCRARPGVSGLCSLLWGRADALVLLSDSQSVEVRKQYADFQNHSVEDFGKLAKQECERVFQVWQGLNGKIY